LTVVTVCKPKTLPKQQ